MRLKFIVRIWQAFFVNDKIEFLISTTFQDKKKNNENLLLEPNELISPNRFVKRFPNIPFWCAAPGTRCCEKHNFILSSLILRQIARTR